jgi:hypothetical protein
VLTGEQQIVLARGRCQSRDPPIRQAIPGEMSLRSSSGSDCPRKWR